MKVVLLGKEGQLGQELSRSLLLLGSLTALGRADLDLANLKALKERLEEIKPDIIVNAAAYTAVDKAETDKQTAHHVNEFAVSVMADFALKHRAILIHYSTDYVFDGKKKGAYLETDAAHPLNIYGASKLAGEQAILKSGCRGYIFRTSWVYSLGGNNFINTILKLAKERDSISIISDQFGAPTSVELISDVSLLAITAAGQDRLDPGVYHLNASGATTWYELARYLIEKSSKMAVVFKLKLANIYPLSSQEYPLPATRPKNSVLDVSNLSSKLEVILPDWRIHVDRLLRQQFK